MQLKTRRLAIAAGAIGIAFALVSNQSASATATLLDRRIVTIPTYEGYTANAVTPSTQWGAGLGVTVLQGDFNGDDLDDFFFYGAGSNPDAIWFAKDANDGPTATDRFTVQSISVSGSYKPFVGDFDGDWTDDIFWYAPGPGPDSIWYFDGGTPTGVATNVNGSYQPVVADFDQADQGATGDIFWYNQSGGESMWSGRSNRTFQTRTFASAAPNGSQVLVGNFTADSALTDLGSEYFYPDLFFYTPGTGADALWSSTGTGTFNVASKVVNGDYKPVVGTFDTGTPAWEGGLTDIFWYAPGLGYDTVWMNTGSGFTSTQLQVKGTYKPFVIPGTVGNDVIVWNNPSGSDAMWVPHGSPGTWSYSSAPFPGADIGSRTPYVGFYDDVADSATFGLTGGPLSGQPGTMTQNGAVGNVVTSTTSSTTTSTTIAYTYEDGVLPRADVLWFDPSGASGQTEVMWRGVGADITTQNTWAWDGQGTIPLPESTPTSTVLLTSKPD